MYGKHDVLSKCIACDFTPIFRQFKEHVVCLDVEEVKENLQLIS